ncbi:predicted protein [Streptomyces sp. SPB78]|nr:predicted protein [Streptomyces sp. SPB78]
MSQPRTGVVRGPGVRAEKTTHALHLTELRDADALDSSRAAIDGSRIRASKGGSMDQEILRPGNRLLLHVRLDVHQARM